MTKKSDLITYIVSSGQMEVTIKTPFPANPSTLVCLAILKTKGNPALGLLTEVSEKGKPESETIYVATENVLRGMGRMAPK